jgi:outer membrane phospholipase A
VLGTVVLLCGGGGTAAYFLLNNIADKGQGTPTAAVDGFLNAVFTKKDSTEAEKYVCSAARKKADLTKKIDELKAYEQNYKSPRYTWGTPVVESQNQSSAKVTVAVKFITVDERVAEQKLRITATNDKGWWVCDVQTYT